MEEEKNNTIEKKIKKGIFLKKETTFKIGGQADYFVRVKNEEELKETIHWAKEKKLPFFILGGGSNLLVSDSGIRGLVIKIAGKNISIIGETKSGKSIVKVWAGTRLSDLINFSLENGFAGLEWAAGIPGSVGGAVRGNIGAFGGTISKKIKFVTAFDASKKKTIETDFSKKECKFSEKWSIFRENKNLIITYAVFLLDNGEKEKLRKTAREFISYRLKNHPLDFPSAGCIFKNNRMIIKNNSIISHFPEIKKFNAKKLIPTSYLIDAAGLKGQTVGGARVSKKHANFIVNYNGKAKASDVLKLIKIIKENIKEKFGIEINEEIEILP